MAELNFPNPATAYTETPWTDPNGQGWLYSTTKNRWAPLGGFGSGIAAALALDAGSAGAVQLNNGSGAGLTNLVIDGQNSKVTRLAVTYSNGVDFTTSSASFVNVTGIGFPVKANKNYSVSWLLVTNKNDASGMQIQFTGPASPTKMMLRYHGTTSGVSVTDGGNFQTSFSSASGVFNTVNGDGLSICSGGMISNGANAGMVQLQLRVVTGGTAKIHAGSWIQICELN